MAMGIPVVASKTKVDQYYFNESQIKFFEKENHADMARCILELNADEELKKSMVEQGKLFIDSNNWGIKKNIYYKIIGQLNSNTNEKTDTNH
jgi:glycosyltransferase involved in cell wall biosynthesis